MAHRKRVAVIGGGITGLSAAHRLASGADVHLFEAQSSPGGKIRGGALAGRQIELGADAFLTRVPWAIELVRGLGLEVTTPVTSSAYVVHTGSLKPLHPGPVLGLPSSLEDLVAGGILTKAEARRAAARDLLAPRQRPTERTTIAEAVRARLGPEVLDRFTDPLLSGIYAGDTERLSLVSAAPQLAELASSRRSWLRSSKSSGKVAAGSPFGSTEGGLSAIVDAVAKGLGGALHTGHPVEQLTIGAEGVRVVPGPEEPFDAVLITTPAFEAARLLERTAPEAAQLLGGIVYASVGLVCLAFPPGASTGPGSGFLVPRSESRLMTACTFVSNKWGRPLDGPVIVRCSVGRYGDDSWTAMDDESLTGKVLQELSELTPLSGPVTDSKVVRWMRSLPQYEPGHASRLVQIRKALPEGVEVTGAAFEGVGIAACVRQGVEAAERVLSR